MLVFINPQIDPKRAKNAILVTAIVAFVLLILCFVLAL